MSAGQTFQGGFGARHSAVRRRFSSSGDLGPLDFQFEIGQVRVASVAVPQDSDLGLRVVGAEGHGGGRSEERCVDGN